MSSYINGVEIYEGNNEPVNETLQVSTVVDTEINQDVVRLEIADTVIYLTQQQAWDLKDSLANELGHN